MTPPAHAMIVVLPLQPLHNLVTRFFPKAMQLKKYMVQAYATHPPIYVVTAMLTTYNDSRMNTLSNVDQSEFRDEHSDTCEGMKLAAHDKVQQSNQEKRKALKIL